MPTYAILGATGATGGNILRLLLEAPVSKNTIHVYVRSSTKLLGLFPNLSSRSDVQIYEGSIGDTALVSACLAQADVVFSCVAENENVPGLRTAQDISQALINALKKERADHPNARVSHVLVLSAAPINPVLSAGMPAAVKWLVCTAFSHVYADLEKAQQMLRDEKDWLPVTFVQPPGLTQAPAQGYRLEYGTGAASSFLSYSDLAAAMIEVADRGPDEERDWVGVGSAGGKGLKPSLRVLLPLQFRGMLAHYAPKLWLKLRAKGLF